jgi:hypothetical protein
VADLSRRLEGSFGRGSGHGLLQLGGGVETALLPVIAYWGSFGARYVASKCAWPDVEGHDQKSIPPLSVGFGPCSFRPLLSPRLRSAFGLLCCARVQRVSPCLTPFEAFEACVSEVGG